MLAMAREAMARMASTQQLYYALFSRTMVSLKKRIAERKKIVYDHGTGKKRGKYNINTSNKRQDQVESCSSIFNKLVTKDNETYLLLCGGGHINSKYNDQFMFVKTGRAPDSWVECFAGTQLLSNTKMKEVKISKH